MGAITGVAVRTWGVDTSSCYVATTIGLFYYNGSKGTFTNIWKTAVLSVAYSPLIDLAAAGDANFVALFTEDILDSMEWVTDLMTASGGVYDGPALAVAFDDEGSLYLANEVMNKNVAHAFMQMHENGH